MCLLSVFHPALASGEKKTEHDYQIQNGAISNAVRCFLDGAFLFADSRHINI